MIRELLDEFGDELRYVWRHLPLSDVHPNAQMAAEATEAAGRPGGVLADARQAARDPGRADAARPAGATRSELGLDVERFWDELRRREHAERVAEDVASADASGVAGTPSFFINGSAPPGRLRRGHAQQGGADGTRSCQGEPADR